MSKGQAKILALGLYQATHDKENKDTDKVVVNFFRYLREHRLRHQVPEILAELEKLYFQENNITKAHIWSKGKLDETMIKEISKLVAAKTKKDVRVKTDIDDSLVGGALVRYGDKLIDITFKKQLSNLAKKLST